MRYPHLLAKLYNSPLALHRPTFEAFHSYLTSAKANDGAMIEVEERDTDPEQIGSVAVVHINGVIDKHMSQMDALCYGGCDLSNIDEQLIEISNDGSITHVVLAINSPGGGVIGVPETAARIAELRESKEVHAFVDVMAASAGYWLASQADIIAASPSAIIGSIGVYTVALDLSKYHKENGLNVQMIKAGKWKDMGSSHRPLTEKELEKLQKNVDDLHEEFRAACLELRAIDAANMEGQTFSGYEAEQLGLIDRLTNSNLDEYVASLLVN
jgi:protease-4